MLEFRENASCGLHAHEKMILKAGAAFDALCPEGSKDQVRGRVGNSSLNELRGNDQEQK